MGVERRQKSAQAMLKKFIRGKDDPEALAGLVERAIPSDLPGEEAIEEIIRWFLMVRDSYKDGTLQAHFPVSQLTGEFRKVVVKRNIDPERFYSALLERMFLEAEHDETARVAPGYSTKERILESALDTFSEKGFHLATVDEIADRAGVGKGTLYRYFANKETLFNELVQLRLEELETSANAILDGQDDVLIMIEKYLRTYLEFFDKNQGLYRLIVQERPDVGAQVQDRYVKKIIRRIPLLMRKIHEASRHGVLKDVDFQTVFHGVMGFIHGVIQKWLASDCSYSLLEELPTVMEVLFYGFVRGDHQRTTYQEKKNGQECS
ncbi:MAG: TetR/AcrR family transcriptional regulator [Syntrophobacteraceae bacterium]